MIKYNEVISNQFLLFILIYMNNHYYFLYFGRIYMFKVMVIDDEPIIRTGLRHVVDWESLGFQIVAEAKNGIEALNKLENEAIDLIITDIKMPQMDGIELLKALREKDNPVKVILLSGYAEFAYAQKGLSLGAMDYLLKPMDPVNIEEVLKKVHKRLTDEKKKEEHTQYLNEKLELTRSFLREKVISDIIHGKNLDKLYTLIEEYDIPLTNHFVQVAIIELDDFEEQGEDWLLNGMYEEIADKVQTIIKQELEKENHITSIISMGGLGSINIIIQAKDISDKEQLDAIISKVLDKVLHKINNDLSLRITIGIGKVYEKVELTYLSYFNAKESLKHKYVLGGNKIIHILQLDSHEQNKFIYPLEEEKILISYILFGDSKSAKFLEELLDQIIKNNNYDLYKISLCFTQLATNIYQAVQDKYRYIKEIYNLTEVKDLGFLKYKDIEEIKVHFINNVTELIHVIQKYGLNSNSTIVNMACEYVLEHIDEKITLASISEYLHISKNYFCSLFKQETGENFLDYLTKAKMDRAKVLLKEDNYKIYEISDLLGYKEKGYFSKLFKKYTGFTPAEYKKNCR